MTTFIDSPDSRALALSAADGDQSRLWYGAGVIRVMPPQASTVPAKVTRRQFKQGITRLGIRPSVEAWRTSLDTTTQAGQDAADWYDDSNEFERANPILNAMAAQFGLSTAQVDAAFVMMAGL